MKAIFCIFLLTYGFVEPLNARAGVCGYEGCPVPDPTTLNVHLVPHSHDDVGWLKTVNEYYYGMNDTIQNAGVQYIMDSVIVALRDNPNRRFIQVETAFFWQWWQEQDDITKQQLRTLVDNGQFEIVGGAWSMNDEAAVHYHPTIDQFTWGLRIINDTLGPCGRPRVGWQIDPFGHSREMASIFSSLGYDGVFFARFDYRDKAERLNTQTSEMLWLGSDSLGNDSLIFTHALFNHYSAPSGYCWDITCTDGPVIDNINSANYNLETKVKNFGNFLKNQATFFKTNNIIVTMGDDFMYQNALKYYKNMDKLIKGFSTFPQNDTLGRRISIFYSTPSCYLKAVNEYALNNSIPFPVKTDDFLPYASDPNVYWTGFFTSRSTSKRLERQASNILQVVKQLTTCSGVTASILDENITPLREASGIMQHHDAITGTEKQHVSDDYAKIVTKAIVDAHANISSIISKILDKNNTNGVIDLGVSSCLLANVSHCPPAQAEKFVVTIHNPLSRTVSYYVRLPVNSDNFTITGPNNEDIVYQVTPSITNFSYVESITPSKFDLIFLATNLPPLGIRLYYIVNNAYGQDVADIGPDTSPNRYRLGDNVTQVLLDQLTGKIQTMTFSGGIETLLSTDFLYYIGADSNEGQTSGAYIFRPSPSAPAPVLLANTVNVTVYKGLLLDEAHQVYNDWLKAIVRVYKGENHVELDWIVGPVDISDNKGKEIILRVSTDTVNAITFGTDGNGRERQNRQNKFRLTYNYTDEEPISGNYFPVTTAIMLNDDGKATQVTVLTDRPQGGASHDLTNIDLMIHRRLVTPDGFGESLNEMEFGRGLSVRGQHFITIGNTNEAIHVAKDISQRKHLTPWVFVGDATSAEMALPNLQNNIDFEFFGLTRAISDNVQILTLEPWTDNTVLLRLENVYENFEDSTVVTVDLEGLFTKFDILSLHETTLGANQWIEESVRLSWIAGGNLGSNQQHDKMYNVEYITKNQDPKALLVLLAPMEIRTFIATVTFK